MCVCVCVCNGVHLLCPSVEIITAAATAQHVFTCQQLGEITHTHTEQGFMGDVLICLRGGECIFWRKFNPYSSLSLPLEHAMYACTKQNL